MNNKINSLNTKLKNMVRVYQHMSVLEIDNGRKLFTSHGLNLNAQGKEALSKLIVSHTYSVLENKMDPSVNLNFKSDQNQTFPLNHKIAVNRPSTRPRKTPLTKSHDFLW